VWAVCSPLGRAPPPYTEGPPVPYAVGFTVAFTTAECTYGVLSSSLCRVSCTLWRGDTKGLWGLPSVLSTCATTCIQYGEWFSGLCCPSAWLCYGWGPMPCPSMPCTPFPLSLSLSSVLCSLSYLLWGLSMGWSLWLWGPYMGWYMGYDTISMTYW